MIGSMIVLATQQDNWKEQQAIFNVLPVCLLTCTIAMDGIACVIMD